MNKRTALQVLLILLLLFPTLACGMISQPPSITGRLLLEKRESKDVDALATYYELREGMTQLSEVINPDFDASALRPDALAVSPDKRYFVLDSLFLLDAKTGESILLPGMVTPEHRLYMPQFSPDGTRLSYRGDDKLYVRELAGENKTWSIHTRDCAEYMAGTICEAFWAPSWINSEFLIFDYHDGLSSFTSGGDNDPRNNNRVTVTNFQGDVILSKETDGIFFHHAVGGIVCLTGGSSCHGWLDSTDLLNGVYKVHDFDLEEGCYTIESTISRDGRYILADCTSDEKLDHHWRLIEVQTGNTTVLGTTYVIERGYDYMECLWSPDETSVACRVEASGDRYKLLIVPLSSERGGIMKLKELSTSQWRLVEWQP